MDELEKVRRDYEGAIQRIAEAMLAAGKVVAREFDRAAADLERARSARKSGGSDGETGT